MTPLIIAFIFAFVIFLLIYTIRKTVPVTPFIYSNARIAARSNLIVSEQKLNELTESKSLKELITHLRDSSYGEELEKIGKESLPLFHAALEKGFLDAISELKEVSPKKSRPLFDAYIMFLEAKMLRVIFRALFQKTKANQQLVFSIGSINDIRLKHLLEAETIADAKVVLEPTPYNAMLKDYDSIEEFEIALDEFILNRFVETAKKTKMYDAKYIIEIVNKKIDILNLLALIKFRIRETAKEKQEKLLIDNKSPLAERFKALIEAETLEDFAEKCKGLPYHEPLEEALKKFQKDGIFLHFETSLLKHHKKFVLDKELSHTLGPYPLFAYLTRKEFEQRNLFAISKGIDAKLPAEKIKEMLV